ncbi:MAG TPA: HAMP domain-containing sensor histidine kinase [Mizugakiibacter sp.]
MNAELARRDLKQRLLRQLRLAGWMLRRAFGRLQSSMFERTRYSEPKMVAMAWVGGLGFPMYYLVWTDLFPQPYENLPLRLLGSALFLPLAFVRRWPRRLRPWLPLYWYATITYALAFFFTYMMLRNGANPPWLMSHLAAVFLILLLFDVAGFVVTSLVGTALALFVLALTPHPPLDESNLIVYIPVLLFAVVCGGVSSLSHQMTQQARVDALIASSNNIAHELRTPLASVRVAAQAVRRYLPILLEAHRVARAANLAVPELRLAHLQGLEKGLDTMEREVTHANTAIDMLLVASRPIDEVRPERVSARHCVREALERYPFGSGVERDRVGFDDDGADFTFSGSELLVVHVLFNLIKNALLHTGRAGKGDIRIALRQHGDVNRIVVRDTGPGIPPDVLPRIFDRFFSHAEGGGRGMGMGIGLAYSRAAMERMQGSIRCRSRLGEYTEFVLEFPRDDEVPPP